MDEIKVQTTRQQKIMGILTIAIIILAIIVFVFQYWNAPQKIGVHFDFYGNVDRYGNKQEMLLLPFLLIGLYLLLTFVSKFPTLWNTGVNVTPQNQAKVYEIIKDLIYMMRLFIVITIGYLMLTSISQYPLSNYFTIVMIAGITIILVFNLVRVVKASKNK